MRRRSRRAWPGCRRPSPRRPSRAKTGDLLLLGQVEQPGRLGEHPLRDRLDVVALVPVLGHRPAERDGLQAAGEPLDLRPGVVHVVLAAHVGAAGLQQPGDGVPDRGPPRGPEGDRTGRVGRDELQVELLPGQRIGAAVGGAGGHRLDRDLAERALGEGDVEEAGTGHVHRGDAGLGAQLLGEELGDLARRPAGGLGQPEGDVGGVVAVLAVLGPLDDDLVGHVDGEHTTTDGPAHGGPDDVTQLLGCHRVSVLTAGRAPGGPPRPHRAAAGVHPGSRPTVGPRTADRRRPHRRRRNGRRPLIEERPWPRTARPTPPRRSGTASPRSGAGAPARAGAGPAPRAGAPARRPTSSLPSGRGA